MSLKPYLLHHLLEKSALQYADKVAIKHESRTITFRELYEESVKMAGFLMDQGLRKGERVGIFLQKSIEQLVSMFGISMAGGVFVFINPILKRHQVEYIIQDCQVKLLISTSALQKTTKLTIPETFLFIDETLGDASFVYWHKVKDELPVYLPNIKQIADDISCLIYTSGSTGLPKGVVVPHRTLVEGAEIVSTYLGITEEDILISVLPFNFDYGLNQATTAILNGSTLVMHQFFLPGDLLRVLEAEEITGFAGMSPIWVRLFNQKYGLRSRYDLPNLRFITNTGGKVAPSILAKMHLFFPNTQIFLMYGLTEAFRSTYLPPEELERRPNSMGKAIPNVEILVINDHGEECQPGEPGELVHKGALITKGYWNDSDKTKQVFRNNPLLKRQRHLNEIVVYSGDLVKKDEEGFLYFISRRDEMIKTSGYRVSPTEVEDILIEINNVSNAVVFSREIETGEQIIVAVVEADGTSSDTKTLTREAKKRLPPYMVPQEFHIEKSFKTTANGKIDRSFIKQKYVSLVADGSVK
jgi:acyl-CoA ligase (AMP-forming) (exosortase A-associated)